MSEEKSKEIIEAFFAHRDEINEEVAPLFKRLNRKAPKNLDTTMQRLHEEAFEKIDCLDCGNCCKTISPAVTDVDINRLAKHLRIKPSKLVEQHFQLDTDGDYIFKNSPCPFIYDDNYCGVYEARPRACREYPHTDRRRSAQILDITQKNCEVCPAVYDIVSKIRH